MLKRFAEVVSRQLRPTDAIGRLGGEEFMILLPGTSSTEARVFEREVATTQLSLRFTLASEPRT